MYLIVNLVFSHLGFWSGNLFLFVPFPDRCLLVPFYVLYDSNLTTYMSFLQRHWIEYYRILVVVICRVAIYFTFIDSC